MLYHCPAKSGYAGVKVTVFLSAEMLKLPFMSPSAPDPINDKLPSIEEGLIGSEKVITIDVFMDTVWALFAGLIDTVGPVVSTALPVVKKLVYCACKGFPARSAIPVVNVTS